MSLLNSMRDMQRIAKQSGRHVTMSESSCKGVADEIERLRELLKSALPFVRGGSGPINPQVLALAIDREFMEAAEFFRSQTGVES
jgi:hypothetical protein